MQDDSSSEKKPGNIFSDPKQIGKGFPKTWRESVQKPPLTDTLIEGDDVSQHDYSGMTEAVAGSAAVIDGLSRRRGHASWQEGKLPSGNHTDQAINNDKGSSIKR